MAKVNVARGMRDLLPETMRKRRSVIQRIEQIFRAYGFDPIETPAVERIETLMGKYGDEGSKLIFKILARGEAGERGECDMALRYDLTVPLARVVAMNQQLKMPFKRYQPACLASGSTPRSFSSFISAMLMWLAHKPRWQRPMSCSRS